MKKEIYLRLAGCIAIGSLSLAGFAYAAANEAMPGSDIRVTCTGTSDAGGNTQEVVFTDTTEEDVVAMTDTEQYELAKIAMAEAEGEGVTGKALVIAVVINRTETDGFPDTIEEVIFEDGQFTPVSDGRYDEVEPDDECWQAVALVQDGWDESQGATYFEANSREDSWHARNLEFLFQYGNHYFYREWEEA